MYNMVTIQQALVIELDDTLETAIRACVETDRKITAIKLLRAASDGEHRIDLLAVKTLVEFIADQPYSDRMVVERVGFRNRFLVRPK